MPWEGQQPIPDPVGDRALSEGTAPLASARDGEHKNQVGLRTACFVYDDREGHAGFVANPRLSEPEGEETLEEGCLSIPGPYHPTVRAGRVRLRGAGLDGRSLDIVAEGLLARIFQHETDHLNGMLYIDRLDDAGRRDVMRQLREFEVQRSEP